MAKISTARPNMTERIRIVHLRVVKMLILGRKIQLSKNNKELSLQQLYLGQFVVVFAIILDNYDVKIRYD